MKEYKSNEELIKYYPIPEDNYQLETINIIDSQGNEISYNNNSFTMPENDVTIVATFNVENPKTGDISIIAIITIMLTTAIILIIKRKREA